MVVATVTTEAAVSVYVSEEGGARALPFLAIDGIALCLHLAEVEQGHSVKAREAVFSTSSSIAESEDRG
jgi:hypothetical protein